MNKTYKVIWNSVKNAYVVVSELAHKSRNKSVRVKVSRALAVSVMLGIMAGQPVFAAEPVTNADVQTTATVQDGTNVQIGAGKVNSSNKHGIAISAESTAPEDASTIGKQSENSVAIGTGNQIKDGKKPLFGQATNSANSTAIGNNNIIEACNVYPNNPTANNTALGSSNNIGANIYDGLAIGSHNILAERSYESLAIGAYNTLLC